METLDNKMTCTEIKLSLIEQILKTDCESWTENNKNKLNLFFTIDKIDLNEEIEQSVKDTEVGNMNFFSKLAMPTNFFIEDIEATFRENVFWCDYVHIYFIKNVSEISLLFRFNRNKNYNSTIKFDNEERLYELKNRRLSKISTLDATDYINKFKVLYDDQNFDIGKSSYTEYVTFDYTKIRDNFKEFPEVTNLIIAAKIDEFDKFRLNIILQINREYCKYPKTPNDDVFFNIGNMQP